MEMQSLIETILIAGAILFVLVFLFLPSRGLLFKWKRSSASKKRVLIEDALKHIYDCEYKGVRCSLESIAGNLSITGDEAAKLLTRLESIDLINSTKDGLILTSEGRAYALRVIRIHRLWEKYLADETSVKETDWHTSAEEQEHKISNEEAEKLAARIGNPVFDPHGDPIPTSTGDLPEVKWKLLTELKLYDTAKIVHIEDEPRTIYSQIVAEGLYPGTQLQITDISNERIKFEADGNDCILAPVFAANISVVPIEKKEEFQKSFQTLSALSVGEKGMVIGISKACRGQQRRRLMDLGIVPGSVVSVELKSLTGDPTAYKIRGATVALRKEQSNNIFIEDVKEESEV